MTAIKSNLEILIAQTKTIGTYIFDEEKQCFFGDAEIELVIARTDDNHFQSVLYYFDGYEIGLEDHQIEFYKGDLSAAKKMAIESFNANPELFMEYPIFYTKISCHNFEP